MIPPGEKRMPEQLGFALTRHCNLRCPHCIRDDVGTVGSLPVSVFRSVTDQAMDLFGDVTVSMTGGEPLLHPHLDELLSHLARRGLPWRIVTNGWHTKRALSLFSRYPPELVRLSLSGADERSHDEIRGRGSFQRVLLSAALLTSRRMPFDLSLIVDRRTRPHLGAAADLAESLGAVGLQYILPQPVAGSLETGTEIPLSDWADVRDAVRELAGAKARRARLELAYGAPFDGPETPCGTKALRRLYVDSSGRLCSCCQLSDYGGNEAEIVADLTRVPLALAWPEHVRRVRELAAATARRNDPDDPLDPFPCLRCARTCGKAGHFGRDRRDNPDGSWSRPAGAGTTPPALVQIEC